MSDSVRPHGRQPTRLPRPWDSLGKNTGVGCHFLLQCVKVKSLSHVQVLATAWTAAHQAPPSMGFSRQEDWSGVPLPSPSLPLSHPKSRDKCAHKRGRDDVKTEAEVQWCLEAKDCPRSPEPGERHKMKSPSRATGVTNPADNFDFRLLDFWPP